MKWCWKQLEGRYSKLFKLYIIYSIDKYRQSSYLSKKKTWGYYFLELQTHTHKNPHVYEAFIEPDTFSCYYWNKMPCYFSLPFWNVRLQSERIYGKSHNWTWIMKWYNNIIITIRSLCTFYCIFNVDKKNVSRKPLIMHKQCNVSDIFAYILDSNTKLFYVWFRLTNITVSSKKYEFPNSRTLRSVWSM